MKSIKNKYIFFIFRILKDLFKPTKWDIAENLHEQQLKEYYFLFQEKALENQKGGQKSIVFDANGIPMNPTYIDVKDKAFVYFPITIGQVGLAVFHTYLLTKSDRDRQRFMKFVDWFYEHAIKDERLGVRWMTDVALPQYKNPGPWQSGFVQGRGISSLLRGYQLTGRIEYAEMAEKALRPFTISVQEGGVTSFTEFGPFYEEYTAEVPTLVLNGMIFSLCGIYDFVRVFPENKLAKKLFEEGIQTIIKILPQFDLGYWSRYNLCDAEWYPSVDPATITYQHLHVTQLSMLYRLTNEDIFTEYAERFQKQIKFRNVLRMYFSKYSALKIMGRI
ncbi:MAG: hypothetical protein KAW56_14755 [Candidatus Marinimicrobia bacterium]|nr:hypothetical protein [Candidatus Neomarinimicrobiota bacterium]